MGRRRAHPDKGVPMFSTLNLSAVTETARQLLGGIVTGWLLSFGCTCSVRGYQHGGTFLASDHSSCWRHCPTGAEPMPGGLMLIGGTFPTAAEHAAWRTGFSAGYRTASGWTVGELERVHVAEHLKTCRPFAFVVQDHEVVA